MAAGDDSSVPLGTPTGNADTRLTANGDHRQVVALGNAGDVVAGLSPWGALDASTGPATLFYDTWTGPLDTTDKWTVTGTAPVLSGGNMTMSATVSTYNAIRTKDLIRPNVGHTYVANGVTIETGTTVGAGRFWGLGTTATTPAPGVLCQDGIGFELDQATGALLAVTYSAGVRTTVATLTKPTDGLPHRYAVWFRVTSAYWSVDNLQVPVASVSFPGVTIAELPALIVRQNASSFTGTPVFTHLAHLTADTSRQVVTLGDPVIGTRQARVSAAGAVSVAPTGAGTGTLSSVSAAASSTSLLAANSARLGAIVYNDSTATLYLGLTSGTVSTTAYTVQLPAGAVYELSRDLGYTGALTGIWSSATGAARLTELTA